MEMENQWIQSTQTNVQRVEIKSLEQMETFLENLQATASDSLAAALNAQLQVIRYANSPRLLDSTFDLLFQNLKEAKEYAATPREQSTIMKKGALMIQNYVFFMDAKLTYALKKNKEDGRKLIEEAGKQLSKSIVEIANAGGENFLIVISNNFFGSDEQGLSIFDKFLRWWNQENINKEKEQEFYKSLESLVSKLNKRKDIIGQSDLIAGLVERYTEDLTDYATSSYKSACTTRNLEKEKSAKRIWISSLSVVGCSLIFLILRWILHLLQDAGNDVKSWFSDGVEKISRGGWVATHFMWTGGLVALVALILFIVFLIQWGKYRKSLKEYINRYNEVREYYNAIAASFEE